MRGLLANFPTEKIRLVKASGETKEVKANVQPKKIFIDDTTILIEEGDIFERDLPMGATEQYEVTDRGFYKGLHGIPDHYQVSVQKLSSIKYKTGDNYTYNINNNGKVNVNSLDNSININLSENDEKMFLALEELASGLNNKVEIINSINSMRESVRTPNYASKYNDFIQIVANHMTIFAPFIPILTNYLVK
ncbi:MAG: hypothetical protein WBI07_02865 [Mobilitalea sp.]